MNWGAPWWLWELAGVGVFALVAILVARRSALRTRWPRIARVTPTTHGVRPLATARAGRRPWLLMAGVAGTIVALARPQWGTVEEPVYQQAREVMLALDLSRSMRVEDVPPSRLGRARLLVQSLLDGLKGERVGLIVFAGTAFVQVPLSADYQILHDFLPELNSDYMPQGGTDYAGMLRAALDGFSQDAETDRYLIVLSDGESLTENWRGLLPDLRERGVRVLALGTGTAAGGFIPDGQNGYVKDERGAVVLSKLESATLRALAAETRGEFRDASTWVDLPALLAETVARGQQGRFTEQRNVRHLDRFQWFLAPAVLFALLGLWREIAVRPRQRTLPQGAPTQPSSAAKKQPAMASATALTLCAALSMPVVTMRAAETGAEKDPAAPIRETVARLAASPAPTARDWRELAERTLEYGTAAKMNQHSVAAGAVHDALDAVDAGERQDPKLTNWTRLRDDLAKLIEPPPEQNQQQQEQPPQDQENKPESQDQSQQEKSDGADQPKQDNSQPDQPGEQQQTPPQDANAQPQPSSPQQQNQQPKPDPSSGTALGDLSKDSPPASPPNAETSPADKAQKTRKFGGRPAGEPPTSTDPDTAVALQRLREATEKDSPALLFQMLENETATPAPQGRDW